MTIQPKTGLVDTSDFAKLMTYKAFKFLSYTKFDNDMYVYLNMLTCKCVLTEYMGVLGGTLVYTQSQANLHQICMHNNNKHSGWHVASIVG